MCHFSLTVRLKHAQSGTLFYLTNVYGPSSWNDKREFCAELEGLKGECRGLWVMCRDFNLTRGVHERLGRSWCGKLMAMFSDLVSKLEMLDLSMGNQRFTWSNLQSSPTLAKLDRFLISTEWDQAFPLSKVVALPRVTSDHSLILLSERSEMPPRMFRFEDAWLLCDDFCGRMAGWWAEVQGSQSSILAFTAKLRHSRRRIKEWCSASFHDITKARRDIAAEIQALDLLEETGNLSTSQLERRAVCKQQLSATVVEEEVMWKARAKQHWLREGDGNTKFFHAVANGRRRRNHIEVIEDQGLRFNRETEIKEYFVEKLEYFVEKFQKMFAPRETMRESNGDWADVFGGH